VEQAENHEKGPRCSWAKNQKGNSRIVRKRVRQLQQRQRWVVGLRVTPAMEAGITDHVWTLEAIVGLIDA
jgi:hypothetical protein